MTTQLDIRTKICEIISEMLDEPDEIGIYKTGRCYDKLENFITTLLEKQREEYVEMIEKLPNIEDRQYGKYSNGEIIRVNPAGCNGYNLAKDEIINLIKSHDKTS